VGKLRRREPLAAGELGFVRSLTDKPVKVTLPGPYLLARAMWVTAHTRSVYADKVDMARDLIGILREELAELADAGAEFVQFDEPVLSEVVHGGASQRRTFMCATLATRQDPASELAYAAELLNAVVDGFEGRLRIGLHVCRGNWSRREDVLLSGTYQPLVAAFEGMRVRQFVLEYATPRAGELSVVGTALGSREIGLGVVNPRSESVEEPDAIIARVEEALRYWAPESIFLNPDCGFACFANRSVNEEDVAAGKLRAMSDAARRLRG
jgi:5-methyltetrahydropteroyltriglutamate--homocysteine methyltransferase